MRIASSSVAAHERCSCSTFGIRDASRPDSRAPSRNRASSASIRSMGPLVVMSPSATAPARRAVTGPAVATRISGAFAGMVQSRVVSSLKFGPACRTSRPASDAVKSLRITSIASNMRLMRSGASGQYCPTTCSLSASPEPMPSQCRPGCIAASVALACATTAGCVRKVGVVAPGPKSPRVRSPIAPSTLHTCDDCPARGTHGWKWSVAITPREAVPLRERRERDRVRRGELLEHRGIADVG